VRETGAVLERLGADVTLRLYPSLGHTVNQDEIDAVNQILAAVRVH
jgi:predicted esterase